MCPPRCTAVPSTNTGRRNLGWQWVARERLPGHDPTSHQGSTAKPVREALPAAAHGLLHSGGRHGRRRAGHGDASERVDDGDGVAAAGGSGLVEF